MSDKPVFSPDGRWWWDGKAWQPTPGHQPIKIEQTVGMKPDNAFSTGFFGSMGRSLGGGAASCLGCILVPIILIVLFASCAAIMSPHQ